MSLPKQASLNDMFRRLQNQPSQEGSINCISCVNGTWSTDLKNFTLVVGYNGSGKTRLLKALDDKGGEGLLIQNLRTIGQSKYINPTEIVSQLYDNHSKLAGMFGTDVNDFFEQYEELVLDDYYQTILIQILGTEVDRIERYEIDAPSLISSGDSEVVDFPAFTRQSVDFQSTPFQS
ncbi:hypothetical protein ACFOD1_07565 [Pseudidiomarina halophila]|uniref:Uncharacterized protein n=1 Tax=Pseudidiomarina halophila TaxID=1449799 RepID=A0A432XRF2_9GAMM|nr:hypothetical protein [Pseudidiomarina halophila]RUO51243.1 hypothetical protein CWI69_12000 [Pseudidiomarina halophila]